LEYSHKNESDVCKIFKKGNEKDFHHELEFLKQIRKIPFYTNFTPAIKGAFSCKYTHIQKFQDIEIDYSDSKDDVYQIVFTNGGTPLNKITHNINFSNFIQYFRNFIIGIKTLQDNDIVHRDIKPTNVLLSDTQLNLIDFGLSCRINEVYKQNDEDTDFILSYMYMYHPPEFYIIHLLYEQSKMQDDFDTILDNVFHNILPGKLRQYYDEHYYKYFRREAYNIFSYKQAFNDFYKHVKKQNIKSINDMLTKEFILKADVFSISFLLKTLKPFVIFNNFHEKLAYNTIYDMTYSLNVYERTNIEDLLTYIHEKNIAQ
jgi:serine/threonine protein kinase